MTSTKSANLRFDFSGCLLPENGLTADEIQQLGPALQSARDEAMDLDVSLFEKGETPDGKAPLDSAFVEMPRKILDAYQKDREGSELGRILTTAKRIQDSVDKVVLLGIGGSYMGARALMEGCCQPYFNELNRAARGGKPKLYFEGNNVDNDATQGLFRLFENQGSDEKFAIVVISKSGGTMETAVAFRQFLDLLSSKVSAEELGQLVVPVTGETGKLADLSSAIGCQEKFIVPDGVGGRFSILSPVGLLPAAILGLDVVALLEGAVAINENCRSASVGQNAVLDYVAVNHLLETKYEMRTRLLSVWAKSLESAGLWYDQLLSESLGKKERGALPLTVVNSRDLHSRAQQHQEGRRDKVVNNIIVDSWHSDPLPIGTSKNNQDNLNDLSEKALPEIMTAAVQGTNKAYRDDNRPTTDLFLPQVDEFALGQYFQMMMLATVIEGRMIDINPYGQPGVEKYKVNMNEILRG